MEKQFNKGDVIFRQGDDANCFYRVVDGSVGIFSNYGGGEDYKLADLARGQFFGEMAVIDAAPRSGSAIVLEDGTRVEQISTSQLNSWFLSDPGNITKLMKVLSARLRDLTDEYDKAQAIAARLGADDANSDEAFLRQFRKYSYYYKIRPSDVPGPSAEVIREKKEADNHSGGFSKNVVAYPKGTVICREGDLVECMYDIHSGRVGVYTNYGKPEQVELTVLGANNFFGEMGMVSGTPRSATAVALDDETTIEIIYPEDLYELFTKNPMKIDMILRHLSTRLRHLTNQYLSVCGKISEKTGEKA